MTDTEPAAGGEDEGWEESAVKEVKPSSAYLSALCALCGEQTFDTDRAYVWLGPPHKQGKPKRLHLDCLGPWADRELERRNGVNRE